MVWAQSDDAIPVFINVDTLTNMQMAQNGLVWVITAGAVDGTSWTLQTVSTQADAIAYCQNLVGL